MKGWIKALSVPLITALVLTGCGSGASTKKADRGEKKTSLQKSGNDTVLRVSGAEEDTELLKQVMENFKKDNPDCPYTLEQVTISESNARDAILGDINNAPDVFTFADDQLRSMIASGILGEVTDESALSENVKAAVEAATVSGKTYAYPLTADNGYFLYYNKAFFTEEDVATLDRLLAKAASKNKKVTMDMSSGWYLYAFYGNTGLKLQLAEDGITNVCDWNSRKNKITGMDVARAMAAVGRNAGFKSGGDDVLTAGAKDGSVVAGVSGVWQANVLKEIWGDKLGAVKLPTYTVAGKQVQMASFAGYKMVGVNHFSEKEEWGKKLAAYMTNQSNQELRFKLRGQGPSNTKASQSAEVKASPAIQAVLAQSEYASLQRIGGNFWGPATELGNLCASGSVPTQKTLDKLVKQITASVAD